MNSAERVFCALRNEQPDSVPVVEFVVDEKVARKAVPSCMDSADCMDRLGMDGVGCGDRINALAAENYPGFWEFIKTSNDKYIHREISPRFFSNIARPRLDAARFMWKNVPTLSFSVSGSESYYHNTKDSIEYITPEILEDMAQLIFMAVMDMADEKILNFRN